MNLWSRILLGFSLLLTIAITLLFVYTIPFVRVEGPSMEPALSHGDLVCVWRTQRGLPWNMVVIRRPDGSWSVKRVIVIGGNTIDWDGNDLIRLDRSRPVFEQEWLEEKLAKYRLGQLGHPKGIVPPPAKIPLHHVYLLGDNRLYSEDSRHWGPVPESDILGVVWFKWPF